MSCSPADDTTFMLRAVTLAERAKGDTAPNPCVGAVLVREGRIVAEGWHTRCGQPHAEVECLRDAANKGVDPAQCVLYVTLEPCNHYGKTPPCTQAILEAGIGEVVIGALDPNPHVVGGGADFLRQRGVSVRQGVAERECLDLIADFILWKTSPRPYNYLKMASTLDGRIAAASGDSNWVSCAESRAAVHELRARVGAVIVGGQTFRADNPRLTARVAEDAAQFAALTRQPLAVVVSSLLPQADAAAHLLRDRPSETLFWTSQTEAASATAKTLKALGCSVWGLPAWSSGDSGRVGGLDFRSAFERLRGERGCHYTLCEGGGRLAMSLVDQKMIDEFQLFLAPKILGDAAGIPLFAGRSLDRMSQSLEWRMAGHEACGTDLRLRLMPKLKEV